MEDRKRTVLAIIISAIIVAAIIFSFSLGYITSTTKIVLADSDLSADHSYQPEIIEEKAGLPVDLTPETVQSVISMISRYPRYSRTVSIQYIWPEGSETIISQIRADEDWYRCDTELPNGMIESSIIGDNTVWYWYDDGEYVLECPAYEGLQDLIQYIPTYEDVLMLDRDSIINADYEEKNGMPCIFVEAVGQLDYLERYWISSSSGLLVASETEKNGTLIYSMSSDNMVSPMADTAGVFELPDGTVLHEVQEFAE